MREAQNRTLGSSKTATACRVRTTRLRKQSQSAKTACKLPLAPRLRGFRYALSAAAMQARLVASMMSKSASQAAIACGLGSAFSLWSVLYAAVGTLDRTAADAGGIRVCGEQYRSRTPAPRGMQRTLEYLPSFLIGSIGDSTQNLVMCFGAESPVIRLAAFSPGVEGGYRLPVIEVRTTVNPSI